MKAPYFMNYFTGFKQISCDKARRLTGQKGKFKGCMGIFSTSQWPSKLQLIFFSDQT